MHLYEGHSANDVVHPVRTVIAAGAKKIVLTNASGGVDPLVPPGSVVVIRDHLNFTGTSPLEGLPPPEGYGSRFVDLTDLYSERMRAIVRSVAPELTEGVYLGLRGPHYETPAEIVMARTIGASLVGMSTVLEAIAARHLGAEVLGLSLVSNFAAGVAGRPLSHLEVLETGQKAAGSLGAAVGERPARAVNASLEEEVRRWIALDPDEHDREELQALLDADDETELERRFRAPLTFGTAGTSWPCHGRARGHESRDSASRDDRRARVAEGKGS